MASGVRAQLKSAIALLLKPLVRLLISQGVTHADFSETAKEVYVETALRHFDISGGVNRSRVAVLTGLTRKEVKNVIDRTMASEESPKTISRPERVMTGWFSDPKYTGPYGLPLDLPYEDTSPEGISIVTLMRTYSADMSPRQLLGELIAAGCVVEVDDRYRAVKRMYEPEPLSAEVIDRLGNVGYWVLSTIVRNMEKAHRSDFGYFERTVFADDGCTDNVIADFDVFIKERGAVLIDEIDVWFATNSKRNKPEERLKDTGFYMVHYIDDKDERPGLKDLLVDRGIEGDS